MITHIDKTKKYINQIITNNSSQKQTKSLPAVQFIDNRPEAPVPSSMPIQRRLPQLTEEFIANNEALTRDLLKNAIQNLSPEENEKLAKNIWRGKQQTVTPKDVDTTLKENLKAWYDNLAYFTPTGKKMVSTLSVPDTIAPTKEEALLLKNRLLTLTTQLSKLYKNHEFYKTVFGPECDTDHINNVFYSIWTKAYKHYNESSKFVEQDTENVHNKWVEVGGLASQLKDHVTVSTLEYKALLEEKPEGLAVIIHEFSHKANPSTTDITYDLTEMQHLSSQKRVKNAENYAQAYLQYFYEKDARRVYNPELVVPETVSESSTPNEHKERRISSIISNLVELWNLMDNAYSFVKKMHNMQGKEWGLRPAVIEMIGFATYPHKIEIHTAPDVCRALIEDRTKQLKLLQNRKKLVEELKTNGITKTDIEKEGSNKGEIDLYTALALRNALYFNDTQAQTFIKNWEKLRQ